MCCRLTIFAHLFRGSVLHAKSFFIASILCITSTTILADPVFLEINRTTEEYRFIGTESNHMGGRTILSFGDFPVHQPADILRGLDVASEVTTPFTLHAIGEASLFSSAIGIPHIQFLHQGLTPVPNVPLEFLGNTTISGDEVWRSYAGFNTNTKSYMDNLHVTHPTIPINNGGPTLGPITVTAVPEPSAFLHLGLIGIGMVALRFVQQRKSVLSELGSR